VLKLIIEDDEGRKTVVPFVRDEITIGRQEGNTIRLTERNVSRRHARLMRNNGHVLIEDLGSYNGIKINGDKISGQVQIADGDLIQIGDYDLAIQAEEKAAAPTVPLESSSAVAPTRKLNDAVATMPSLPAVEPPAASDDDVREADSDEVGKDAPPPIPKHQSTAVIRIDQLEGSKKRAVAELESSEAPRLVILNTDLAGREFTCNKTEMKIGRVDDNDIAIDHRSLSRTHCKVVREESGEWRVIDMQSANGLMVNGESYAQVTLRPGDVIELGHVKLKFVGPGENVEVSPATSSTVTVETDSAASSKMPLIAMAVALLVIILGGGGYMLWKSGKDVDPKKPKEPVVKVEAPKTTDDPPKADLEALRTAANVKLSEAKEAAIELDWAQAEVLAKEATVEGELLGDAKTFLAQLDSERGNKTALEAAAKHLEAGNLEKAKTQLDSASGTRLLRARYDALEKRRSDLVAAKVAANQPTKVEPKAEPKVDPVKKDDPKLAEAESLYKEAADEKKAKNFERAAIRAERCVKIAPSYHPCYRMLGTVYAAIANRDQSANDMEKARKFYERFLEVAPPDDDYVPKVRAILDQAK
jgi:ABC transport system ATP-binding/permease protein